MGGVRGARASEVRVPVSRSGCVVVSSGSEKSERTSKNCTRLSPTVTSRSPVSHLEIQDAGARQQVAPEVPVLDVKRIAPKSAALYLRLDDRDVQSLDLHPIFRGRFRTCLPTTERFRWMHVMLPVTLMLPRLRCYIETSGTARWIASHSSPNSISSQKSGAAFISSPWAERASSVTACLPEHRSAEETLTQPKTGRVTRRGASRQRSAAALATTETECSSTACSGRQRRG